MIEFKFIPHFAIRIACAFVFFTAVGTMTHELGHWSFAKYFGYDTHINYRSVRYFNEAKENDSLYLEYKTIWEANYEKIRADEDFEEKARFYELAELLKKKYPPRPKYHSILITLGGPLQTIFTSILGLLILFYRQSKRKEHFVLLDWLGVFLALFILREVFNFVMAFFNRIILGSENRSGDEFKLSYYFELNPWVIPAIGMIIGTLISCYVIFRVIPLRYRLTFIIAGFGGGILGFFVWLRWLGPVVIP